MPSAAGVMQAMTISPARVVLVLELLDGALPAGADRAQRRMPAEIGQVEAQRRGRPAAGSVRRRPSYGLSVDVDRRHSAHLHGQRFSWMCRSKSSRKILQRALQRLGRARAPGRRRCCRARAAAHCAASISRSPRLAFGRLRWPPGCCATQGSPSRQGVHQPHDSWAKKCSRLSTMPTGQVWSSRTIIVPVPRRLPAVSHRVEVHRHVQVLRRSGNRSRRRRGAGRGS